MADLEYRTFDGTGNNFANPDWGTAGSRLLRLTTPSYYGSVSKLAGRDRPNPRLISNTVCSREVGATARHEQLTDFVWAWGQFIDHEMDLTGSNRSERANIQIPPGDPQDGFVNGGVIPFPRSNFDPVTGTAVNNPREQTNSLSSYIDAANVYGANPTRAAMLRAFDGTGKLKTSHAFHHVLLPLNVAGFPNVNPGERPDDELFVAGDVRANEHVVLLSLHTLFMREHNRLCERICAYEPGLTGDDEAVYQRARKTVGALMQVITYEEFLPALLGDAAFAPYGGYNEHVDATISNVFSTVCFRFGHSMLSPVIQVPGVYDEEAGIVEGRMPLRDGFFRPDIVARHDIDAFLLGLTQQTMREIDVQIEEEVRSFLFHNVGERDPSSTPPRLLDLAALNIQRGRDHGLPDYNQCRADFGLPRKADFTGITGDPDLQARLAEAYGRVELVDPWIGALAEDHLPEAQVGELISVVLQDQFRRLRDGDRFWYEHDPYFAQHEIDELKRTRLADVVRRNTGINDVPAGGDVFRIGHCAPAPKRKKSAARKKRTVKETQ